VILMSYNILEGAQSQNIDRTDAVISVIRSARPTIVGLCECTGFWDNDGARLRLFEAALGMRAVMNRAPSDHHVALLYDPSVRVLSTGHGAAMMYNGYARLLIEHPKRGRVLVLMTHLHPCSPLLRLGEAETILVKATFEHHALVMGDFNCLAQGEGPQAPSVSPNARARLYDASGHPDCRPVERFLARQFMDLGAVHRRPTYPTSLFGKDKSYPRRLRLDYMFASRTLGPYAACEPVATAAAEEASDHLPLICELSDQ